jgi:hypothetical protein
MWALLALTIAAVAARETSHSIRQDQLAPAGWTIQGDATIFDNFVRLVPDRQSKRGAFWNNQPVMYENWEVTYDVRIHGVSLLGADGIAFWYVRDPFQTGDLYGSRDLFHGISIILDTYDNDKSGVHPYLFGIYNDGTFKYSHDTHDHRDHTTPKKDGSLCIGELNGCTARIRNLQEVSSIKVSYVNREFRVLYRLNPGGAWTQCFTIDRITLPVGYYFGFSAATGELADDHDLYNVTVSDPFNTPQSAPASIVGAAPVTASLETATLRASMDTNFRVLQTKMDGLLEVMKQSIQAVGNSAGMSAGRQDPSIRGMQNQIANLAGMTGTMQELSTAVKQIQTDMRGGRPASSSRGFPWISIFLVLGLSAVIAYLSLQLRKERRSKKLF